MANVTPSQCQKYANVTPCQYQKNANRDAIWVLSITRRDQFLAFLGSKEGKKLILTYIAMFRGQGLWNMKSFYYVTESL